MAPEPNGQGEAWGLEASPNGAVGGTAERTKSKKELAMDAAIAQAEAEAHAEASAYAAAHTYAPGTSAIHQWTFGENRGRSEVGALG